MEYCPGGDMGQALAKHRRFDIEMARTYAAEIVLAIEYLHKNDIIFRDLKPDNVVFDEQGHALLTDFGLSKTGMGAAAVSNSFCGSVAYLAPEMLRRAGHTKSIDWYLLGVLIYEMLVGVPPYFNPDKAILFKNIEMGPLKIPHTMPQPARNIILLLLNRNPAKRLGSNSGAEEIKKHEFFESIDWDKVHRREYTVLQPKVKQLSTNQKAVANFFTELEESEARFKEYQQESQQKDPNMGPSRVEGWSFISPGNQRPM